MVHKGLLFSVAFGAFRAWYHWTNPCTVVLREYLLTGCRSSVFLENGPCILSEPSKRLYRYTGQGSSLLIFATRGVFSFPKKLCQVTYVLFVGFPGVLVALWTRLCSARLERGAG